MQLDEQRISKGDHLSLSLASWGRLGEAMAFYQGREVFVFGGIPGEEVVAEVIRVRRKYVAARVLKVLKASPDRVEPLSPYFGECTGCQWQHVTYPRQLATKREMVIDALVRVGGFSNPPVSPVLPSPEQYGYRNHARFTVGPDGVLGFVNRETHRFVRIDHCCIMHQGINRLLAQLQGKCHETTQLAIRAGKQSGDGLIQPRLKSPDIPVPTGQKHYLDSIGGRKFRVASPSFFQVNAEQAARLVEVIWRILDLKGDETLLDAYTGVGTFAILLAPYVRKVIAVEESAAAVADARENAAGLGNVDFVVGKTEDVLQHLDCQLDVVVLDPPRAGCQPEALQRLIQLAPPRIAYVSCDPETLGRDLKLLCHRHYVLDQVEPLDMFPQTYHVECVALLSRLPPIDPAALQSQNSSDNALDSEAEAQGRPHQTRNQTDSITLASASPRRRELLSELGLEFQVIPANVPEDPRPGESAPALVRRLSLAKALAVLPKLGRGYVIGADSVVALDGRIVGKPADAAEARRMLRDLRATTHHVITGLTVIAATTGRRITDSVTSTVTLRNFSDGEMEAYIDSGAPLDKAGAYAIQDRVFHPAQSMDGCYTNVVGLPLCRLVEMLRELGYQFPPDLTLKAPEACVNCRVGQGRVAC